MIEHGVAKMGGTKLLGTIISPGFAILALGGIIAWKLWENKQEIREIRAKGAAHKETLENLNTKLEVLNAQKLELLRQVTQIQEKLLAVPQKVKPSTPKRNPISQTSKPTTETPKLAIFKQIIEENLDLRKAIA